MTGGVRGKRGAAQPAKKIGQRGSSPGEGGGSGRGVNGNSPGATLGQRTKERGEGGFAPPNRVGAAREGDLPAASVRRRENDPAVPLLLLGRGERE
jgi:hypothetical protein